MSSAVIPARPRSASSPRPSATPTRTVAALEMPSGIMNAIEAICSAMPCAASGTVPSQPIITEEDAKSPTSAMIVTPIGQPSRSTSRSGPQSGRQKRAKSS